ncbi:MAG: mechanosensitive ion channel family protein [Fidelibacterota bacterium]
MIIVGAITAAGTLGIDVSALVAGLGLTGFALGFAFRDMLSNLIAGTMILIYRPFQADDRIAVAGSEGRVIEISLRYTTILTESGKVHIPNATLYKNAITVFSPTNKTEEGDQKKKVE